MPAWQPKGAKPAHYAEAADSSEPEPDSDSDSDPDSDSDTDQDPDPSPGAEIAAEGVHRAKQSVGPNLGGVGRSKGKA